MTSFSKAQKWVAYVVTKCPGCMVTLRPVENCYLESSHVAPTLNPYRNNLNVFPHFASFKSTETDSCLKLFMRMETLAKEIWQLSLLKAPSPLLEDILLHTCPNHLLFAFASFPFMDNGILQKDGAKKQQTTFLV